MTSVQNHESSYESGQKPYKHDKGRGIWENPADYLFACINSAFGSGHFSGMEFLVFSENHNFLLGSIYYILCMLIFAAPIIFIQGFLGQFSSSGYISVFRIAPFFKGLGYAIFLFNFMVLTYTVVFAAVPLFYTGATLFSLSDIIECNNNTWNKDNCEPFVVNIKNATDSNGNGVHGLDFGGSFYYKLLPAYEYYSYHMNKISYWEYSDKETSKPFNWWILLCSLISWTLIYHLHSRGIEWVGKVNRYVTIGLTCTLLVFVFKAFCIEHLIKALRATFDSSRTNYESHLTSLLLGPILCLQTFGRGCCTFLTMASHNKFRANIAHQSLALVLMNLSISICSSFIIFAFYGILSEATSGIVSNTRNPLETIYVTFPTVFGSLSQPRLFLLIFFSMLALAELFSAVIIFSSLITSFFDEFDSLRHLRKEITMGFVGFFTFSTTFYGSGIGIHCLEAITQLNVLCRMLLFSLLILVAVWIYGRERLQRDILFMIGIRFHTSLVYMIRFVTPIVCVFLFGCSALVLLLQLFFSGIFYTYVISFFVKVTPLLIIPGYMVYVLRKPTGSFMTRLRKLNRPTDWYPVGAEEKQKYEANLGTNDMAEPLALDDFE